MFSLMCAGTNGWANSRDAGGLRCHCAHYDVTDEYATFGLNELSNEIRNIEIC